MSVGAMVTVQLDVTVTDSWGDDCTLGQIRKQAQDSARNYIVQLLSGKTYEREMAKKCGAAISNIKFVGVAIEEKR